MNLKQPSRKRTIKNLAPFPTKITEKFVGYFSGFSVIVKDYTEAQQLIIAGCFGKYNLSRTYSNFHPNRTTTEILRKRQHNQRKLWTPVVNSVPKNVVVVPDSDHSGEEEYFTDLKVVYDTDKSGFQENLHLSLVEAYFLSFDIGCLTIYEEENKQNILHQDTLWSLFSSIDDYFVVNYAVYLYFRAKNWTVRNGIKFGGDYVLYKEGPSTHHSSYVVVIDVLDGNLKRIDSMKRRSMEYLDLARINRICNGTQKDLLICQLIWLNDVEIKCSSDVNKLSLNEVLMRRWTTDIN